ncbi:insulinase family protein [Streptomyces sp. NPDC048565]|uniref:M16 family metallopeptidase n=1 Tax=Streptomyces sp. NPDC048565 TaxID=3155266 RepID=UPI00344AD416
MRSAGKKQTWTSAGGTAGVGPLRATLSNGLRVLLEPRPEAARVALCVTYGVGFRSERPGQEGLAHLFEHLMFRGSESLPDGRFFEHVHRFGGEANGTTHQDYTDYYQVVPSAVLEPALFGEADRMRAPRFTPETLGGQLAGVEQEIRERTVDPPLGGFPWPLLPQVLYRNPANAHDGFGDIERLRRVGLDDCAEFFETHYAPGNAVLTLVGGFEADRAMALIERHFGDIPARVLPARPVLDEPLDGQDRWLRYAGAGVPGTAVAVGHPLLGPDRDLDGYLAAMVLARVLGGRGLPSEPGGAGHGLLANAGCGFFGPLDARDPDAFLVVGSLPHGADPEQFAGDVRCALEERAVTRLPAAEVTAHARGLGVRHLRRQADLSARSRSLGRFEQLFDDVSLLDETPRRLAELAPDQISGAAASLARAHQGVLAVGSWPGEERRPAPLTHGAPPHDDRRRRAYRSAGQLARSPEGPRPVPAADLQRPMPVRATYDEVLPSGLRLLAVTDSRDAPAEIRLRLHLGAFALTAPHATTPMVRALVRGTGADRSLRELGGGLTVRISEDGQWLEAAGYAPAEEPEAVLGPFADLAVHLRTVSGQALGSADNAGGASQDAAVFGQALDRELWAAADVRDPALPGLRGGSLAVVAGWAGVRVARAVHRLFPDCSQKSGRQPGEAAWHTGRLARVPRQETDDVRILLCRPEPPGHDDEAARYLATALLGGYFRGRLGLAAGAQGIGVSELFTGRDLFVGTPRAWIRARVPGQQAGLLLKTVRAECARLGEEMPADAEVARAAEFCAGQLSSVYDSPSALADALSRLGTRGWTAADTVAFPERLHAVAPEDVSPAAGRLFGAGPSSGVLLGRGAYLDSL